MNNNILRVSIIQSHIEWEDRAKNLHRFGELLRRTSGRTHLAVLPEMFSTGFSMRVESVADAMDGETVSTLKHWASAFEIAIAGSFMASENGAYYNRAFFVTPEGEMYCCDKRHLFGMGNENKHYTAGNRRLVIDYRGWKICPLVCYDLRFPVWSRNVRNGYDLLIYVANWPATRRNVWKILLPARAVENMAYVCGVNRIGVDGYGYPYGGESMVCSPRGNRLINAGDGETVRTCLLKKDEMEALRTKFPVWKDADSFVIE
ncbi:MAG: amidohydrolase [Tannerella sp.]|jgi:predicted amidohydrolase|nr:amidohydrolase [Tannerella sp.]